MLRLTLDNQPVEVPPGTTVLEAARRLGIEIPTLCHLAGYPAQTSCLVCLVRVNGGARLLPACATPVAEGMVVESETEEVHAARRTALELLLGDHLGDCQGPCQSMCPAHPDLPGMLRLVAEGRLAEAAALAREALVLPATLGYVCPALCEKGCRRGALDRAVEIRETHRTLGERVLREGLAAPLAAESTGKRVAIIGGGPAGLGATYGLLRAGHVCALFEEQEALGGQLRRSIPPERLPREVLAAEAEAVVRRGAEVHLGVRVGHGTTLDDLRGEFDAVLVAAGQRDAGPLADLGLAGGDRVQADRRTHLTDLPGVFAAGAALAPTHEAVRAVASGLSAAHAITLFLAGRPPQAAPRPWGVHMGQLSAEELAACAESLPPAPGGEPVAEAARCLHCECAGLEACRLRKWAEAYQARPGHFHDHRRRLVRDTSHPDLVYEPGKCVACGLCVEITRAVGEPLGLTFVGRGFEVRVAAPLGEDLAAALRDAAVACAEACPTGALVLRREVHHD